MLLIINFAPTALELNLLGECLVLQGSCAFLALLMVDVCLYFVWLDLVNEFAFLCIQAVERKVSTRDYTYGGGGAYYQR